MTRDSNAFKEQDRAHFLIAVLFRVSLYKAQIQHWVVTKSHRVRVIKHQILDGFLSNSVLASPESHQEPPRGNMEKASHIFSTITSVLLSGHKGPRLSSPPRVLKWLSDGTHPARPCDGQPVETSIHYTDKTVCHLGPSAGGGRSEKHLYIGSKVSTNSAPGSTKSPTGLKHVCVTVIWLCPTLCDPIDYSPPGSSVHGISQARILEWVTIPFFRQSSQPRD